MLETKTKTFVYKNCTFHKQSNDLEGLLKRAVGKLRTVGQRRQSLAPEGDPPVWLVIAQKKMDDAFFFGLLVNYTPGMTPSFLVDDEKADDLRVEHLKAPNTKDGKERQLLESMLFFAVTGNHLVMMQSLALRAPQLERHLQWLLHYGNALEGDDTIQLTNQIPKNTRQRMAKSPIKRVTIGGELSQAVAPDSNDDGDDYVPAGKRMVPKSLALRSTAGSAHVLELLKDLAKESGESKLNLDDIDGANIEYSLEITYKRETTDEGQRFLKRLGSALRHADDVTTEIKLAGGGSIKGDELRLSGPVKIQTRDGIPNPDDVFEAMRAWLLTKVTSGDIER